MKKSFLIKPTSLTLVLLFGSLMAFGQLKVRKTAERQLSDKESLGYKSGQYIGDGKVLRVSKGKLLEISLSTSATTELATGFDPKVYYAPMDAQGKYFFAPDQQKIYQLVNQKLEQVLDVKAELVRRGFQVFPDVYLVAGRVNPASDYCAFTFSSRDSASLSGTRPFLKYPALVLFNLRTAKLDFLGTLPAISPKNNYWYGRLVYNDASKNRFLTAGSNQLEIMAYDAQGNLLAKSAVPDSLNELYFMYDKSPQLRDAGLTSYQKHGIARRGLGPDYYHVIDLVRLNANYLGLSISNGVSIAVLVFDNDLKYKGSFPQEGTANDFVYSTEKEAFFRHFNKITSIAVE